MALAVVAVACGNGVQSASHGERRSTSTPGRRAVTPALSAPASSAAHAPAPPGVPTPNPALTPGAVDPRVTQSNLGSTICRAGYTRTVRNVPQAIKNRVYKEYALPRHRPGEYEVDHLVALELGGSNDITNLWPEPYNTADGARTKDRLENSLKRDVCSGRTPLVVAQHEIATNWFQAFSTSSGG